MCIKKNGRHRIGEVGEQFAREYVERTLGWRIWKTNFRCREGEIDIAAVDGNCLVVVEVKTRRTVTCGDPLEAVDQRKLHRLKRSTIYLLQESPPGVPPLRSIRFDLIGLLVLGERIVHFWHIPRIV